MTKGPAPLLTDDQQAEAIRLYAETNLPIRTIADMFGVSRGLIMQLARKAHDTGEIETMRGVKPAPRTLKFTVPAHIGDILAVMPDKTPSDAARRLLIEILSK